MSRARHNAKHRAEGGKVEVYAGEGSNVLKEANERKRGGAVHEAEGEKTHHRADRRARGGAVAGAKHGGAMKHHKPGRKRGGAVGADKHPLSSAASVSHVKGEI